MGDVQDVPFGQGAIGGTRGSITDGADVYDWFDSGPDSYDVGAGGTDPFGGKVYARAYCIKLG